MDSLSLLLIHSIPISHQFYLSFVDDYKTLIKPNVFLFPGPAFRIYSIKKWPRISVCKYVKQIRTDLQNSIHVPYPCRGCQEWTPVVCDSSRCPPIRPTCYAPTTRQPVFETWILALNWMCKAAATSNNNERVNFLIALAWCLALHHHRHRRLVRASSPYLHIFTIYSRPD